LSDDDYVLEYLGLGFELPELPSDRDARFHYCQLAPALQAAMRFYREI
jgi:hypothetical protein